MSLDSRELSSLAYLAAKSTSMDDDANYDLIDPDYIDALVAKHQGSNTHEAGRQQSAATNGTAASYSRPDNHRPGSIALPPYGALGPVGVRAPAPSFVAYPNPSVALPRAPAPQGAPPIQSCAPQGPHKSGTHSNGAQIPNQSAHRLQDAVGGQFTASTDTRIHPNRQQEFSSGVAVGQGAGQHTELRQAQNRQDFQPPVPQLHQPQLQQRIQHSAPLPPKASSAVTAANASGQHPAPGPPAPQHLPNQLPQQCMPPPPHGMQQQQAPVQQLRQHVAPHEQGPPPLRMQQQQGQHVHQLHQNAPQQQQQLQKPLPPPVQHQAHPQQGSPQQQLPQQPIQHPLHQQPRPHPPQGPQQHLRPNLPAPGQPPYPDPRTQPGGPQQQWQHTLPPPQQQGPNQHPLQQNQLQPTWHHAALQPCQQHQQQPQQHHPHPLLKQQQGAKQPVPPSAAPGAGQGLHPGGAAAGPPARTNNYTATLSLEDGKHIAIKGPYHDAVQAVFSLIPGAASYDNKIKGWTFPMLQYKHVLDALNDGRLRTRGVTVDLQQPQPAFVGHMLLEAASRSNDERLYEKLARQEHAGEQSLDEKMMPFQREGVKHALRLGGRVLIGDEMGLGKTVQACCILWCYAEWPALIVVPKSLRDAWADALFLWLKLTEDDVFVVSCTSDANKLASGTSKKVIIVSYDQLIRVKDKLAAVKPLTVVLDEAHYIKNGKAQRTQAALPLIKAACRAVLLTGTPALSKPAELVPLLQALMKTADISASEFAMRYSFPDKRFPGRFMGARNEMELNRLLLGTTMVRRLKCDVLAHLPPKRRQQVFIRLPKKETQQVAAMGKELQGIKVVADCMAESGGGGLQGISLVQQQTIMRLWRDTAALKAAAVSEYCADLLEADAKFLLFAHHQVLLDAVEKQAKDSKVHYIRIDGATPAEERAASVKRFQEDVDVKIAILSIKAAGVGLTMTASSMVVFAELSWVPGDIQQAEDRCHRIGQHDSVNIHFLLVRDSIDEIMWDTVQMKLGSVGKVLDGSGASIKVDRTREVHGLGANAVGDSQQPSGSASGTHHGFAGSSNSSGRAFPAGPSNGAAKASGTGRAGAPASPGGGATRRISDYFAPINNACGHKPVGGAERNMAGQKRVRGGIAQIDLIDDSDED